MKIISRKKTQNLLKYQKKFCFEWQIIKKTFILIEIKNYLLWWYWKTSFLTFWEDEWIEFYIPKKKIQRKVLSSDYDYQVRQCDAFHLQLLRIPSRSRFHHLFLPVCPSCMLFHKKLIKNLRLGKLFGKWLRICRSCN